VRHCEHHGRLATDILVVGLVAEGRLWPAWRSGAGRGLA
jgi:hypothetical protein